MSDIREQAYPILTSCQRGEERFEKDGGDCKQVLQLALCLNFTKLTTLFNFSMIVSYNLSNDMTSSNLIERSFFLMLSDISFTSINSVK